MVVGLFGGTFDPIHVGHVRLAEQFLSRLHLDEVWFLVTPQNPWKVNSRLSSDALRLALVEKALEHHEGLVASDYEFRLPKPSYTYQTLRSLRSEYPDTEFVLLIGADNWVKFGNWAEHEEILSHHRIAVYPRPGFEVDEESMPGNVALVTMELFDVSSTEIRNRLHAGMSVEGLVPEEIIDLVRKEYK